MSDAPPEKATVEGVTLARAGVARPSHGKDGSVDDRLLDVIQVELHED